MEMEVLQVITRKRGGVGVYALELKKALEKLGIKSSIISREGLGIPSFTSSFLKLPRIIEKLAIKYNAKAILAHDWSIALPLYRFSSKLPVFCVFHGLEPSTVGKPLQFLTYRLYSKQGRCFVVSRYLQKRFPLAKLLPGGVDLELFKPSKSLEISEELPKPIIGYAQWPTKQYHYPEIVEAVRILGGTLLVAWNGIKANGNVYPLGYLPREKMPSFYSTLDAFVSLPPATSGFNLVWLEALACNTPSVGNYFGIGPELPLVFVEEHSPEEIAHAIEKAQKIKNKNFRKEIIKRKYTWENTAKLLLSYLK